MSGLTKICFLFLTVLLFQCSDSGTSTSYLLEFAVLSKVSGDFTTGIAGIEQTTELIVLLSDDVGRPLKGWQIDYTLIKGAASLTPSSSQTDDDGMARTTLSWGSEEDVIEVEARALGAGTSVRFIAAASLSAVDTLIITSKNLVGEPGMEVSKPLIVEARDAGGKLVENAIITFSNGDGELHFADDYVVTGGNGQAETTVTIGNTEGDIPYMVTAYAGNSIVSQNFEIFSLGEERIVYSSKFDYDRSFPSTSLIGVMNPDGSGQVHITDFTEFAATPDWSPDGTRIVYVSASRNDKTSSLKTMNFDGANKREILSGFGRVSAPSWSPSGDIIAFAAGTGNHGEIHIYTIHSNGSGLKKLTSDDHQHDFAPRWHPNGSKIMFTRDDQNDFRSEIYTMNPDGTGLALFLGEEYYDYYGAGWSNDASKVLFYKSPTAFNSPNPYVIKADGSNEIEAVYSSQIGAPYWSPDDSKIIYVEVSTYYSFFPFFSADIFIMNDDGTNNTRITSTFGSESSPKWARKE